MQKPNLFDYINDLSCDKKYVYNNENKKEYNQHLINLFMAMDIETLFYSDCINRCHVMNDNMHYDFYYHAIAPKKRFFKYRKNKNENLKYIQKYYNVNCNKAMEILNILNDDQIENIKNIYDGII